MEITTILTINKKVYSSKILYNSTSTTHVQEIHCDLKCVISVFFKCVIRVYSNVFISVCKLFLLYLYFITFNSKYLCIYLIRSTILFHLLYFVWWHTKKVILIEA